MNNKDKTGEVAPRVTSDADAPRVTSDADAPKVDISDSKDTLLYNVDEIYHQLYDKGIRISDTPEKNDKRRLRFYNLTQLLMSTQTLNGHVIECGVWRGLSSFLICNYIRGENRSFKGFGYHIVDSFEGLSKPEPSDVINRSLILKGKDRKGEAFKSSGGEYKATLDHVRQTMASFPDITYHKGWIPEVLDAIPENSYKFVHIDLDLYQPTLGALKYFYPRLVPGGLIVCDDYGSLFWPGAQKAVEDFCGQYKLGFFALTTGQAVIMRTHSIGGMAPWNFVRIFRDLVSRLLKKNVR